MATTILVLVTTVILMVTETSAAVKADSFETKIVDANIGVVKTDVIDATTQLIFHYKNVVDSGLRVYVSSNDAQDEQPVIVVVRQQKGALSWQIPFYVKRDDNHEYDRYYSVNRTLCPIENNPQVLKSGQSDIYISVSTSSLVKVSFSIMLYKQPIFYITDFEKSFSTQVSPSAPIFFQVKLTAEMNSAMIRLDSQDRICTILSVQNITCPVYDLDRNVEFEGLYQTVDAKTGLSFTKEQFPNGIYIVLVAKTDDSKCRKVFRLTGNDKHSRVKNITLRVSSKITQVEYLTATFGALAMFFGFYVFVFLISCVLCIKDYRLGTIEDRQPILTIDATIEVEEMDNVERFTSDASMVYSNRRHRHCAEPNAEQGLPDDSPDHIQVVSTIAAANDTISEDSSLDETDIDFLRDAELEKDVFRTKTFLYVSDLARKSPQVLAKKSSLYNWNLMTIAVFYGLPVVQLVLTYQNVTHKGNQDMCYFNFLCAHPLGLVTDFNHIFSNLGYVMLGILFIIIVSRKDFLYQKVSVENRSKYGIPQHFGMYYAMGLALIMEGIMSGCYHVCPNHTNFQFDTAFMYTISILILLKIYQSRHPDINANAYTAFGVLAFIIFIGVIGVLHGSIYFWIFFTALHVTSCLFLSCQIYYMGRVRLNYGIFQRIWHVCVNDVRAIGGGNWHGLKPLYIDRMILLLVLNAANWSLSWYGVIELADKGADFASFLLAIFISNVMLYTMFYIVMKLRYSERIGAQPATYILISSFTWIGSMYFFLNKSTTWVKTPAASRELNTECRLFNFYDNHDIWHFLSATSLFLSFMILLTLDDDLDNTPREKIPVF